MKIEIDKRGRKLYKFSHSVVQGGYLYSHKTAEGEVIKNKGGLKNALNAIASKFKLIDPTVKVYDSIFFFFFLNRNTAPIELVKAIQKNIASFGIWNKEYLYTTAYDLQEAYLRNTCPKCGRVYFMHIDKDRNIVEPCPVCLGLFDDDKKWQR